MRKSVAIVTGVSRGLGRALVHELIARNFDVVGIGRSANAKFDAKCFSLLECDLQDPQAVEQRCAPFFDQLAKRNLSHASLWNNAAVAGPIGMIGSLNSEEVTQSLHVNLIAPLVLVNAFVRAFADKRADRRLINVSSGTATRPGPGGSTYSIGKAGLEMLTAAVACETERHGVVAITIRPGVIDTDMQAHLRSQPVSKLPAVPMLQELRRKSMLQEPEATAAKLVQELALSTVENGALYNFHEL